MYLKEIQDIDNWSWYEEHPEISCPAPTPPSLEGLNFKYRNHLVYSKRPDLVYVYNTYMNDSLPRYNVAYDNITPLYGALSELEYKIVQDKMTKLGHKLRDRDFFSEQSKRRAELNKMFE